MKKNFLFATATLLLSAPAAGQSDTPAYKRDYGNADDNFVERTRAKVGSSFNGLFSSGSSADEDVVKVKGVYYMPLYDVNLYKGADGDGFKKECRLMFANRYPLAKVMSVASPQTSWVREAVERNNMTVGYTQTMYCYIIAKDGEDGYINARFAYKRYKDVGTAYAPLAEYWPKWERTDFLSAAVYAKLLKK